MWLKKYFVRKSETPHKFCTCSMYNRSEESQWKEDHTPEVMEWLWKHKMIEWSEPYTMLGEPSYKKYIAYTKIGCLLRAYYDCSYWQFVKYYVLQYHFWLYKVYYPIMIHVFGKHYDWQDYEGVDLKMI